jgi:hypothetical protein
MKIFNLKLIGSFFLVIFLYFFVVFFFNPVINIFNFTESVVISDLGETYNKILYSDFYHKFYNSLFFFDNYFVSLSNYFAKGTEQYFNLLLNYIYVFEGKINDLGVFLYSFELIKNIANFLYVAVYYISSLHVINVLIIILPVLLSVAFMTIIERKQLAAMQRRVGPNTVGYYGVLQPFADALKLILKENVIPAQSNKLIFYLAPVSSLFFSLLG